MTREGADALTLLALARHLCYRIRHLKTFSGLLYPSGRLSKGILMYCPYCARPLKMMGTRCRACRRYILGWPHLAALAFVIIGVILLVLNFI
ncbi:MAG: hypothetical protein WKF84_01090 [Pyrinomonadaceae bacterium]